MTYAPYKLNVAAAKAADQTGRIENAGKYTGVINHIEFVTSTRETTGVEVDFTDANGSNARFTLWTNKSDGTELSGYKQLNALMTCASLGSLTPVQGVVKKYDYDQGAVVDTQVWIAKEVNKTPVGVLLQRENYTNNKGEQRHTMLLFSSFNAQNELMAAEIIAKKTTPEALPKAVERLMANPIKERNQSAANTGVGGGYGSPAGQGHTEAPFLDDGLPF